MAMPLATAFVLIRPDGTGFGTTLRRQLSEAGKVAAAEGGKAGSGWVQGFQKSKIVHVANILSEAMVGAGAVSVAMAAKFDAAMERVHTQAGVAQSQIGSLSKGVLNLAGQVGLNPDSLAESLYHVESSFASLGIKGPKALQLVKIAAQGAQVGGADLVDVTNALTSAVASGIGGVKNFSGAMGALNAIVGSGDMKMQDLAEAFSTGLPSVLKGYGLSLTDLGAGLATFGDLNIRGALAATELRMAVQAMAVPAKQGVKDFKAMGMSAGQLAGDMRHGGLLKALEDLKAHYTAAGITGNRVGQELTADFGKKAGTGLAVLMGALDRLKSKYPAIEKSAKGFGGAWAATQKTASQQMKELTASFQAVAIEVGNKLLPPVMRVLNFVRDHTSGVLRFGAVVGGLALAISAVSVALKVYTAAQLIYTGVTKAGAAISALFTAATIDGRIAMSAWSIGAGIATAAQWLWNAALDANPIGIIIIAIGALVGAVIYAYTHFKGFRDFVKHVWHDIAAWAVDAWHAIYTGVSDLISWIAGHWKLLLAIILGPVGVIVDIIVTQWKHVEAAFRDLWHYIWDDFGAKILHFFTGTLPKWFSAAANWVNKNLVQPWIDYQKVLWRYLWTDFGAKIMGFFLHTLPGWFSAGYKWAVTTFIDPLKLVFGALYQWLWTDFGAKIMHFLIRTVPGWFSAGVKAIGAAWGIVESVVKVPVNFLIRYIYDDGIRKIWNFVANLAGLGGLPHISTLAAGGKIPGFGGGDKHPALLEAGEAVIDKNRTALLAPLFAAMGVPGFSRGGAVGDRGSTGASGGGFLGSLLGGIGDTLKITAALASGNKVALAHAFEDLFPSSGASGAKTGSGIFDLIARLPVVIVTDLVRKAISAFGGGSVIGGGGSGVAVGAAQAWAKAHLRDYGWGPGQFPPLQALWNQESGWRWNALNAQSGAYGIPQSLPADKMAAAGPDWRTNPVTQMRWGLGYIKGVYGSPGGAEAHERAYNWYDKGGWLPPGLSLAMNSTGRPERVIGPGDDLGGLLGAVCDRLDTLIAIGASAPGEHAAALGGTLGGSARRSAYRAMYSPR